MGFLHPPRRKCWIAAILVGLLIPNGCSQTSSSPATARTEPAVLGVFLGDGNPALRYRSFCDLVGVRPRLLLTFVPWSKSGGPPFPANFCRFAREHDAIPVITWEPWDPQTDWFPLLKDIAAGREDHRIRDWLTAVRRWHGPILLRFAHEMNGHWYPWCQAKDARQTAGDYVAAWRRVHRMFREAGLDQVRFIWAPNFEPADHIDRFYPGDDCVDVIGIDLYNQPDWPRDPAEMLSPLLAFADRRGKPVLLTEVGCAEDYLPANPSIESATWTSKPRWIERLFQTVSATPAIHGLIWFDVRKEADWRIDSSPASVGSFRKNVLLLDGKEVMNR